MRSCGNPLVLVVDSPVGTRPGCVKHAVIVMQAGPRTTAAPGRQGTHARVLRSGDPTAMERRTFLKLAAAGTALVAGGQVATMLGLLERVAASDLPATGPNALHQWVFIIDLRRCDGCAECTTACQAEHFLPAEQEWIRVYRLTDASGGDYFLPVLCQMCERPPCVQVCPVTATYRTADGPIW